MHDAVADGADGGFGAVLHFEFREEGLEMRFDGVFGDEEGRGDFLVAAAFVRSCSTSVSRGERSARC